MDGTSPNGTAQFEARINNPDMASALNRLLDRMDSLETAMQQLNATVGQAPGMAAMVGDIADEAYRDAAAHGINLEERAKNGLHLLTQLTEPKMMAQLEGLMAMAEQAPGMAAMAGDMLDNAYRNAASHGINLEERATTALQLLNKLTEPKMVAQLEGLMAMAEQAPGLAAMAGDMVDNAYRSAAQQGIDLEARAMTGLQLLNRLTEPKMATQLEQLLGMADQLPGFAAMAGDVIDDAYRSAHTAGIDIETMVRQGGVAAQRLSDLMRSPEFTTLMGSGMLDPKAVSLLGSAADALIRSKEAQPQQLGPIGLLGALRDPEVQKALGFFMTFAKEFGKNIK